MPLSYPPLKAVEVDGVKKWTAVCRTCGQDVVHRIAQADGVPQRNITLPGARDLQR